MDKKFFHLKLHLIKYKYLYITIFIGLIFYVFSLPGNLFICDYSTIVLDRDKELLGARVASDGQWRFPPNDSAVSDKFKTCLIEYEDQYFLKHPGFNPVSIFRAAKMNIKAGKIKSGGSTITMQVIRLYHKNRKRTFLRKFFEIILATRLELKYSKNEILSLYFNHAPFGGNVVGVQAASWRFLGRSARNLSWAEASLLAVLPNSPSIIHLSKNRQNLINKRNKLLLKLFKSGKISHSTYELAISEPLPEQPYPLPDMAKHITDKVNGNPMADLTQSTIKIAYQQNASRIISEYMEQLLANQISNVGVIVIDVETSAILAYQGNVPSEKFKVEGQSVDVITSPRSTGSILKPVLYAAMLSEGQILPETLVPDIPTTISGFKPENYDLTYDGAIPAKMALSRSLNIPCVRMLQKYGIPKFQNLLTNMGMNTLVYPSEHYGLTLIVGGAEGKLIEIAGMYSKMAYTLNYFNRNNIYPDSIPELHYLKSLSKTSIQKIEPYKYLNAASIWLTFQALLEVNRPDEESGWAHLGSSRRIAWKTGTSYGFRDAWAVGTTPKYVVGVWVGNADGEGRPGLTGVGAAAPLMFKIFSMLPSTSWFSLPYDELEKIRICRQSGYKAGEYCTISDSIYVTRKGKESVLCPYHKLLHLTSDEKYRVYQSCYPINKMVTKEWFILPPSMEWYYRKKNIGYKTIPPLKPGCSSDEQINYMEFIYPTEVVKIFIPRDLDGSPGQAVFELAHRNRHALVYWHLDNEFLGTTENIHQMPLMAEEGLHRITVVDNDGHTLTKTFEVVSK